jgi:hypothetical protein
MSNTSKSDEIGHSIGDQNVNYLGLDVHNPVFMVSAILVIVFLAGTLLSPQSAAIAFLDLRLWVTSKFDWFFMISVNFLPVDCILAPWAREAWWRSGKAEVFLCFLAFHAICCRCGNRSDVFWRT